MNIIRCPIHGSIHFNDREKALIDNPFFQRLRFVSQLGFANLVYPGAVHNRFSHSLGAMHLAGRIFEQLSEYGNTPLNNFYSDHDLAYFQQLIRFTALLHDIGHPPFSHTAESVLPLTSQLELPKRLQPEVVRQATHEDFSIAIVYKLAQKPYQLLSKEEANDIIVLLKGEIPSKGKLKKKQHKPNIFPLLSQMISGEVDIDRMDYLLRDSFYSGVTYGQFDLNRIVRSLSSYHHQEKNNLLLCLNGSAIPAYEDFLLARSNMFIQVYYHKTLAAFGYYLEQAFKTGEIKLQIDGTLKQFLELTEDKIQELLRKSANKKWSKKIIRRTPAKSVIRLLGEQKKHRKRIDEIDRFLKQKQIEVLKMSSSCPFSSQKNNYKITKKTLMTFVKEFGVVHYQPIADVSSLLQSASTFIEINQLYVHRKDYEQTIELLQKHFLKS